MKPLTPIGSPSPLRLLNKGPDYLRRQMDGGSRGGSVSAVERLEADKAKYVKSQQVINTKQEPVPVPCATPPPAPRRPFTLPATPDLAQRVCTWPDEHDDSRKENRQAKAKTNGVHSPRTPGGLALVAPHSAPMLRRSTGKRMLRPDSLLIYRQKKECKSPGGAEVKSYGFVRRLFQASVREKSDHKMAISEEKAPSRDGDSRMSWTNDRDTADTGAGSRTSSKTDSIPSPAGLSSTPQPAKDRCTNGTRRGGASAVANGNHSGPADDDDENDPWRRASPPPPPRRWSGDLRLRRSVAMSEQGRFFDFCGLDMDMIERLGRGNFLSAASSIDTLSLALRSISGGGCGGSEPSEFSRHSGDALFIEELDERLPTGVSIIERNARVIKWLYSCKNAAQEGPKESTV